MDQFKKDIETMFDDVFTGTGAIAIELARNFRYATLEAIDRGN